MNELVAALTRAANAVARYYEGQIGDGRPDEAVPVVSEPTPKTRKPRAPKTVPEIAEGSPFATPGATPDKPATSKLTAEETVEAGRRGQEVMGLFIRRYLKASPTGLERAKKILVGTLGAPRNGETAWKLEHLSAEDWLKLTPLFEAELNKAA